MAMPTVRQMLDDLDKHTDKIRTLKMQILRRAGWEFSCDNPGSVWLWSRTIDGKVFRCSEGTAIGIEDDLNPSPDEDDSN